MAIVKRTLTVLLVAALAACAAAESIKCAVAESKTETLPAEASSVDIETANATCIRSIKKTYNASLTLTDTTYAWGQKGLNTTGSVGCDKVETTYIFQEGTGTELTICACCANLCNEKLDCVPTNRTILSTTTVPATTKPNSAFLAAPVTFLVASSAVIAALMSAYTF